MSLADEVKAMKIQIKESQSRLPYVILTSETLEEKQLLLNILKGATFTVVKRNGKTQLAIIPVKEKNDRTNNTARA